MKVLQCYSSRFLGYFEPYKLDSLLASAIQWKSVYPEDYLELVATEDIVKYLRLSAGIRDLPWDNIQISKGYPNHNTEFYYDYVRFQSCIQQKESFIYLDPDVFIFRELLDSRDFREARTRVSAAQEEHFVTYLQPYGFQGYYKEDLSAYPGSVQNCLKALPETWKLINTGFFLTTSNIIQKISKKVLEVQECFARELREEDYTSKIHEFASSTVPLMVLAGEKMQTEVVSSKYIHHTCGCLFPPESCYRSCKGYFGKDGGDGSDVLFSRRLSVYKDVWKKIIETGYISYKDFENMFIEAWQNSKNPEKKVKKGPILV